MIIYGSVCSGIEVASVTWHSLGFHAEWFSEIELFPSAVLAYRWPDVPNLGDITKLARQILTGAINAPELMVGGTPGQARPSASQICAKSRRSARHPHYQIRGVSRCN